ncbi:MAG: DUF4174 domain-containing protein [Sulfitobacter sp.]
MNRFITLVIVGFFATTGAARAQETLPPDTLILPADMKDLSEFKWKKRPVLVFADSEFDPAFEEQMELLRARPEVLLARDVVVLVDTNPDARSPLRLKMRPRGFMLVLVDKKGTVELRKPFPWDVREISRSIDKMSIRQQEISDRKLSEGE